MRARRADSPRTGAMRIPSPPLHPHIGIAAEPACLKRRFAIRSGHGDPERQRALRACRSVLLLCCLRSPAPLWAAPPCTAELGPGGDVQAALDALGPGPVALC